MSYPYPIICSNEVTYGPSYVRSTREIMTKSRFSDKAKAKHWVQLQKEEFVENKRELSKKLEVQIKAYVNSGGQIQKCTPCTYSDGQRLVMTSSQRNRVCGAIK